MYVKTRREIRPLPAARPPGFDEERWAIDLAIVACVVAVALWTVTPASFDLNQHPWWQSGYMRLGLLALLLGLALGLTRLLDRRVVRRVQLCTLLSLFIHIALLALIGGYRLAVELVATIKSPPPPPRPPVTMPDYGVRIADRRVQRPEAFEAPFDVPVPVAPAEADPSDQVLNAVATLPVEGPEAISPRPRPPQPTDFFRDIVPNVQIGEVVATNPVRPDRPKPLAPDLAEAPQFEIPEPSPSSLSASQPQSFEPELNRPPHRPAPLPRKDPSIEPTFSPSPITELVNVDTQLPELAQATRLATQQSRGKAAIAGRITPRSTPSIAPEPVVSGRREDPIPQPAQPSRLANVPVGSNLLRDLGKLAAAEPPGKVALDPGLVVGNATVAEAERILAALPSERVSPSIRRKAETTDRPGEFRHLANVRGSEPQPMGPSVAEGRPERTGISAAEAAADQVGGRIKPDPFRPVRDLASAVDLGGLRPHSRLESSFIQPEGNLGDGVSANLVRADSKGQGGDGEVVSLSGVSSAPATISGRVGRLDELVRASPAGASGEMVERSSTALTEGGQAIAQVAEAPSLTSGGPVHSFAPASSRVFRGDPALESRGSQESFGPSVLVDFPEGVPTTEVGGLLGAADLAGEPGGNSLPAAQLAPPSWLPGGRVVRMRLPEPLGGGEGPPVELAGEHAGVESARGSAQPSFAQSSGPPSSAGFRPVGLNPGGVEDLARGDGSSPRWTPGPILDQIPGSPLGDRWSPVQQPSAVRTAGKLPGGLPPMIARSGPTLSPAFASRDPAGRLEKAKEFGGSESTETAVEMGLAFLRAYQFPDGRWRFDAVPEGCTPFPELERFGSVSGGAEGAYRADTAATALAVLAFLGAGYTHQGGLYREAVAKGLRWLVNQQKPDGSIFSDETEPKRGARMYAHGMASIALCEAYGMTRDSALRGPAEAAVQFILFAQDPKYGGWRYTKAPDQPTWVRESDTSVSGWQLLGLWSARLAGLSVPEERLRMVSKWLDTAAVEGGQKYCYSPFVKPDERAPAPHEANLAMSAEGLLMRILLGWRRDMPQLGAGVNNLSQSPPIIDLRSPTARDAYYWYYATQVLFYFQGEPWQRWNRRMQETLLSTQVKDGPFAGSWDPLRPVEDRWAAVGGRIYVTALHLLMLEVYYRHLPLFENLSPLENQKEAAGPRTAARR
ncbi:MAG: hypothetical protein NZ899_11160 [Thermoguttaceae bacterium]|nr:hypothetical protein [Thermoguttaceae bacterium]MDW8078569.1 hypothetical protein [Thermoguttaceae bacterium]